MSVRLSHKSSKHLFWKSEPFERWYNRAITREIRHRGQRPRKRINYYIARDYGMIPRYVPGRKYTPRQLELMADFIIFEHESWVADGTILNPTMYRRRKRHEVFVKPGIPDPAYASGLYWRTHPQGLEWHNEEERRDKAASFYKD